MEQLDTILIWVLFEVLYFNILTLPLLFFNLLKTRYGNLRFLKKNYFLLYWIALTLFCVFDKSSGDYFHYLEIVEDLSTSSALVTHLEDFYVWLVHILKGNYFLFRIIVWGLSVFSIMLLVKRLSLNYNSTYIFFALYALLFFSYTRAFLAVSVFFLGYSFIIKPCKRRMFLSLFWGVVLILIASLFLHKSCSFLLFLFPFSFIRIGKKISLLLILLFPFLIHYIDTFVIHFLFNADVVGSNYLLSDKTNIIGSIGSMIFFIFYFSSTFLLLSRVFMLISLKKSKHKVPLYIERMYTFTIVILYVSFIFSFLSFGNAAVSYRLRNMAFIPLVLIISYFEIHKELGYKRLLFSLGLIFIADNCYLGYMYYLKSVLGL